MDIKETLTRRVGPLPMWGWGVVGVGGVFAAYAVLRGRGKGADTSYPYDPLAGVGGGGASGGGGGGSSPVGGGGGATAWNPFDMLPPIGSSSLPLPRTPAVPRTATTAALPTTQPSGVLDAGSWPVRVLGGWTTLREAVSGPTAPLNVPQIITEDYADNVYSVPVQRAPSADNPTGKGYGLVTAPVADIINRAEEYNRAAQSGKPVDMGAAIRELQRMGAN